MKNVGLILCLEYANCISTNITATSSSRQLRLRQHLMNYYKWSQTIEVCKPIESSVWKKCPKKSAWHLLKMHSSFRKSHSNIKRYRSKNPDVESPSQNTAENVCALTRRYWYFSKSPDGACYQFTVSEIPNLLFSRFLEAVGSCGPQMISTLGC